MIQFRSLAALTLAGLASFASACSSNSSSATPTKFTCAQVGVSSMQSTACISCVQTHCDSQAKAEFGSGYASADYSGGACGPWITCVSKCACNDTTCFTACKQPAACMNADQAAGACAMQSCPACQSGGGNDGGTGTTSGDGGLSGVCFVQSGASCPTANLVGCCTLSGNETCFYSPDFTAAAGMQGCTGSGGTWSTSL